MKNQMGKTRPQDKPYLIFRNEAAGWEWRVLKSWQADNRKPFARWFCAVSSPMTFGGVDLGDTYVGEVLTYGTETYRDPELVGLKLY